MLLRKEGKIDKLLIKHMDEVKAASEALKDAVLAYIDGDEVGFKRAVDLITKKETDADEARREAENALYLGGYIPAYREDFSALMDFVDNVADDAEAVGHFLAMETPNIPSQWAESIKEIAEKTLYTFISFRECFLLIYEDRKKAYSSVNKVRNLEKEIDKLQNNILREVFQSNLSLAGKMHLKEFILKLGQISGAAENASDKVMGFILMMGF